MITVMRLSTREFLTIGLSETRRLLIAIQYPLIVMIGQNNKGNCNVSNR